MTVRFRPALAFLPAYVPGRTVPGAIKLASNESPDGPLPFVLAQIAAATSLANRYPDASSAELVAGLSVHLGVAADQLVIGCGSVALCQQLVLATAGPGDEVLFGWRSFEVYPILSILGGADPVRVPLIDHVHDLKAMAAAITPRTRLIFLCNPNNPTGTVVQNSALTEFLDQVPSDVLVVLDEAYREYVGSEVIDGTTLLARYANLIVLRTFSKAYGLAGLRVGYGIAADPAVAAAARATQLPFAVTTAGQIAARASLHAQAQVQMRERVAEVASERSRVTAALRQLGYLIPPSQANFVWLPGGGAPGVGGGVDPLAFAADCERRGVIVRAFADSGVRVSIGSPAENDAFLSGLPHA